MINDSLSPLADRRAELCDLWKWRWWATGPWARRAFWFRTRRTSFPRNMCQQCKPPICADAIIADDLIRFRLLRRFDNHACTITVDSKEYSLTLWWEDCARFAVSPVVTFFDRVYLGTPLGKKITRGWGRWVTQTWVTKKVLSLSWRHAVNNWNIVARRFTNRVQLSSKQRDVIIWRDHKR